LYPKLVYKMVKDFISSIRSYFKAIKIIKELNLWKYFLVPIILGFTLGAIFFGTAFSLSDNVGSLISNLWPWEFAKDFIVGLSTWIGGFSILIVGILLYKHILMVLSSPFMTPVSEKVETYLTGIDVHKTESKSTAFGQLLRSLRLNLKNLIIELLITIPLMILSLIPVIGLIATVLIIYFQSYYTGFGNLDYTLERHLSYSESINFVKKYKGIAIGNGLIFTLMLFIPIIGITLTLPISTVASTIDTVNKLYKDDKVLLGENNKIVQNLA
jgi:CysZ protein